MESNQEPLDQPISLMMSRSEVSQIDDIRFAKRASSRGAVIRDLVKKGMEAEQNAAP